MRAGLKNYTRQANWKAAAITASNLSELELTLGDVDGAVRDAEQSVDFADRSGDAFQRMVACGKLADGLHQAGRHANALSRWREAETLQAERQPAYPLLYSLWGFRYCDLLLAGAERAAWRAGPPHPDPLPQGERGPELCREVERRATQTLAWTEQAAQASLLDFALNHLTLGRARLYRAILERPGMSGTSTASALKPPTAEIEEAVSGLRRAGQSDELPKGLLTRAWLRALAGDAGGARRDLDEAGEIAEQGPMPLFAADVALHRARLFRDRAALGEARRLIEKHGYGRRLEELADAEAAGESGAFGGGGPS